MISKAIARFIRISPRKTRLVADTIRGKGIYEAQAILDNMHKRAVVYIKDVLGAAVASAKRNPEISEGDMYVSKITIDGGPTLKRFRAGSMGRAMGIKHRTSHILIELDLKKRPQATSAAEHKKATPEKQLKSSKPPAKGGEKLKIEKKETNPKTKKVAAGGKGK